MSKPTSLRLGDRTLSRLEARAARLHLPLRTLAQRYVEEGLRRDEHPLVYFADGPAGRRASVLGTGLDVWEVIAVLRDNDGDVAATADYLEIPAHLVGAATTYFGAYRDEVDAWITANEGEGEEARSAWSAGRRALGR